LWVDDEHVVHLHVDVVHQLVAGLVGAIRVRLAARPGS